MRNHTLTVRGREATCSDLELVQGTVMEDAVRLDLDGEWDGLDVTIAFFGSGRVVSPAANGDGTYTVPWEVLKDAGAVYVGVEGRRDGRLLAHARMERPLVVRPSMSPIHAVSPHDPTVTDLQAARDAALEAARRANEAADKAGQGGGKVQSVEEPLALSEGGVLSIDVGKVRGTQVSVVDGRPTSAGSLGDSAIGTDGRLWLFTELSGTE